MTRRCYLVSFYMLSMTAGTPILCERGERTDTFMREMLWTIKSIFCCMARAIPECGIIRIRPVCGSTGLLSTIGLCTAVRAPQRRTDRRSALCPEHCVSRRNFRIPTRFQRDNHGIITDQFFNRDRPTFKAYPTPPNC